MSTGSFDAERRDMVERQLAARGVRDPAVLAAFSRVPRHRFVSPDRQTEAYSDHPLPLFFGQTISQPYIVALMVQALQLRPSDRVLEIGTGSGYAAALLCELAAQVFTVELHPELANSARALLHTLGYANVQVRTGDGSLGLPEFAPFDAVLVSAAAPRLPEPLLDQLADGGRLVVPVGDCDQQDLLLVRRRGPEFSHHVIDGCRFVPLIGDYGFRQQP